ncbi:MAG: hypothetical protein HRU15_16820, partial [Planctomycetes bacterium]|nr:hypothetical protein [Planctomycetota bacterium]
MTEETNWARFLGLEEDGSTHTADKEHFHSLIGLKLAAAGYPVPEGIDADIIEDAADLLAIHRQQRRMLQDTHSPIDQRIQDFIDAELKDIGEPIAQLPKPLELDHHGLARELSLPFNKSEYHSERVSSYRLDNGVLHNPVNDRRTTKGVFHISEGGLPIPADKKSVPKVTFARLLSAAFQAPQENMLLPFTAGSETPAHAFAGVMLRPVICPEIPGHSAEKSMEIRFFAPGSLVCNLDFVESIFGNAGNPNLPIKDSALDSDHWSGHTGCVILATHLCSLKKKDVGLPHMDDATELQKRDGMCWEKEDELYNDGTPFKICHRTLEGVMITIIADNYFGYCKKEVKTQIGYAANLYGICEEEHAGGALAFPRYSLGHYFNSTSSQVWTEKHSLKENKELFNDLMDYQPEGYGIDRKYANIIYVPENAEFSLPKQNVTWEDEDSEEFTLSLQPQYVYVLPSGYKVRMERHPGAPSWRLIGTSSEGTFCHKPCTVSGGGKSEISKNIDDAIIYGPIYVSDYDKDFQLVQDIFDTDYSTRFNTANQPDYSSQATRSVLAKSRTVGSVIKLLTPSDEEYNNAYNEWLESIPNHIKALVFIIKRFYDTDWEGNWQQHFTVDVIDGRPGHELKYKNRKLIGSYLRVGIRGDGSWCTFKLRQDYLPASKVQMEDDITASCIVPTKWINGPHQDTVNKSIKITTNCEYRLFQRPDEAINRGYDKQTEYDMAQEGLFSSNYQALNQEQLQDMTKSVMGFEQFSQPMQSHLRDLAKNTEDFAVSSAHPRIVNGEITKNPRYLQLRPD